MPGPVSPGVGHQAADRIELLVAWEDEERLRSSALVVLSSISWMNWRTRSSTLSRAHVSSHRYAVAKARLRGMIRAGSGTAELALVERKESGLESLEPGGDVHEVRVHGEVRQAAAFGEERLSRIAIGLVLPDRVLDRPDH